MQITRTIKGKVQTYEYHQKDTANNAKLNMRINKDVFDKMRSLVEHLKYKNYSQYVRDVIEKDLNNYEFTEKTTLKDSDKKFCVKEKQD